LVASGSQNAVKLVNNLATNAKNHLNAL